MKFLVSAKSKVLAGVAAVSALSSNALAAGLTMGTNGTVTGDIDPAPFTSMAIAVVTFVALVYAIKAGIRLLGR
ncbi:hypothetical protein [Campylobacter concisus]|uniref:Uncharacterized protein n=1 Tax=Campylobacter concisus (strain 13826) TaxID=360104 RepID=A7ZDE0_CAMC1|nr:hypothetical protein [Campylobacter concisus]EAT98677.1 hypothetical protein CCC13826_1206 [Campylobacter concisus 13826]